MAFLKARNRKLSPALDKIAVDYMRHGEALGMRWDYAFFQMVVETGYLRFERSRGRPGLVRPQQNNFAGLGATGRGVRGESFPDVSTGVLAHLQHVLMYTGEPIPAPVAERTQKVIEWRVLDDWRAGIKGPMTYADLAQRWANNKSYADALATHAEIFEQQFCNTPDPTPELVAEARPGRSDAKLARADAPDTDSKAPAQSHTRTAQRPAISGRELAQRAIEEAQRNGDNRRRSLGGTGLGALATQADRTVTAPAPGAPSTAMETASIGPLPRGDTLAPAERTSEPETYASPLMQAASVVGSILRSIAQPPTPPAPPAVSAKITPPVAPTKFAPPETPATLKPAALPVKMTPPAPPAPPAKLKCRVWTASYGGTKAILIKAPTAEGVSYTVLDVNDGVEKREAAAYISAYARGGQIENTFGSQTQALEKAFELCPEG